MPKIFLLDMDKFSNRLQLTSKHLDDLRLSLDSKDWQSLQFSLPNKRLLIWNNVCRQYQSLKR